MKNRLRRTMMFLNAQKASLVKDAYIYKPDSIIFDLEDAVAENQKDSARIALYNALKSIDYKGIELVVRINGLDTPHFKEDIRAAVAGGIHTVRVPKTETCEDVWAAEKEIEKAEKEFGVPVGRTLMMAAIETPLGVMKAYELAKSSERIMGISFGAGDYVRTMRTTRSPEGVELLGARTQVVIAARAAGIMCFDTVYLDVDNMEGFANEVKLIKQLGFDGKSIISPKQIPITHQIFAPTQAEIAKAETTIRAIDEYAKDGIGVFTVDGQMIDIAMLEGAKRTIALAKASGIYEGDLA
ncbi:aldolase/citrate lyase family protein [Anaerospora sp.]|uniref:aldolase/citrate lyase family protein n=1 Tax=Anaerospora sp. TaxID=1960278 RepID=UPI00289F982C|nr:aldolase/citrate lyase family protein [Anaerospora sp.]